MALFYFYGVSVGESRMNGYIKSGELIDGFDKTWLPQYQRERVHSKSKINALIDIFKKNKPIDSVKLNFIGKHDLEDTEAILDGKFHIIDGQQRILALRDSGMRDIRIPVELYLGISYDEEVKLFHQFNKEPTKLKFGELAKSIPGKYPDMLRRLLRRKEAEIPITINSKANGLGLALVCSLVWIIHKKMNDNLITEHILVGNKLLDFLAKDFDDKTVQMTEFALNNLFDIYFDVFGSFDMKSTCYKRGFIVPCMHVMINCFLRNDGKFYFDKFDQKVKAFSDLLKNSRVKELVAHGGDSAGIAEMYDIIIEHLNHKLKGGHLPYLRDIRIEKRMVADGLLD